MKTAAEAASSSICLCKHCALMNAAQYLSLQSVLQLSN
ncbi:hypothetical protein NP493_1802g00000 [Ridgeia piscesae]|uniref:Uncharacterized protein n=1 Tax=Ridgeia piscesae TaxID=27915 RepID=A0AAD9N631_RIDPI|nr:hypothetical protein NP493_1802g00000 [Ridgeia piscesae]